MEDIVQNVPATNAHKSSLKQLCAEIPCYNRLSIYLFSAFKEQVLLSQSIGVTEHTYTHTHTWSQRWSHWVMLTWPSICSAAPEWHRFALKWVDLSSATPLPLGHMWSQCLYPALHWGGWEGDERKRVGGRGLEEKGNDKRECGGGERD